MFAVRTLVVLILSFDPLISCHNISFDDPHDSNHIFNALHEIIDKSFRTDFSTVNIIKATRDEHFGVYFIEHLLRMKQEKFAVRLEHHDKIQSVKTRKKRYCLILLDDIKLFRRLDEILLPEVFSFRGIFLFVVSESFGPIQEIFTTLWRKNIFNVDVIQPTVDSFKILTFEPFGMSSCGDTTPRILTEYRNNSFSPPVDALFPEKFRSLFGCKLIVSTFEDHFSVIRTMNTDGTFKLSGFDIDILNELSKALQFGTEFLFNEEAEPWGRNYNNGTVTGALGDIVNGKAHLALARLYLLASRRRVADSTVAYFGFPVVFVVPPDRSLNDFEKLLMPFDTAIWLLLVSVLIVALLVIVLANWKLRRLGYYVFGSINQHPTMNLIVVMVGGTQSKMPKQCFPRFLLMMFIVLCLVLRSAYVGSLFNFLQLNKYFNTIESIDDMFEQGYDVYMYKSDEFFDSNSRIAKRFQTQVFRFKIILCVSG